MGQRIDLFKTSIVGDKNQNIDNPSRMGKKENWDVKVSSLSFKKNKDFFEEAEITALTGENIEGDNI
jgi:hypothetical protein